MKPWLIAVIVIVSIVGFFFIVGFIENYYWFRRLMIGKNTLRLGTVSWILISLFMLFCTRKQPERELWDQGRLRREWDAMSAGTKFKLWLKWGFRLKYPVDLLGDPNDRGPALERSGTGQTGQPRPDYAWAYAYRVPADASAQPVTESVTTYAYRTPVRAHVRRVAEPVPMYA